jgi:hypothetical protein
MRVKPDGLLECLVEGDRGGDMRVFELIEQCRLLAHSWNGCCEHRCLLSRTGRSRSLPVAYFFHNIAYAK